MSIRTDLAAVLRQALPPKTFDVKDVEDLPDTITKTTILIRHRNYVPAPNARGTMLAGFLVTVVCNITNNMPKQEDSLEETLPQLLEALDRSAGLTWTRASRVLVKETYLGYDIECTIPTATPY